MPGPLRTRLLPGAPGWLLTLTALVAVPFGGFGVARVLRPEQLGDSARWLDVPALIVLHVALLGLLAWRARTVPTERAVWNRLALGGAVFVVALSWSSSSPWCPPPAVSRACR